MNIFLASRLGTLPDSPPALPKGREQIPDKSRIFTSSVFKCNRSLPLGRAGGESPGESPSFD